MYNDLSSRKKAILKAVVDAHIENGEPVGSKALTGSAGFGLSSATIRNEMAELESMGYLVQPHTSAGRVPTDLGYRFYVDTLMQDYSLTSTEIMELNRVLKEKTAELDRIIKEAGKVVSSLTNYTSIALSPRQMGSTIKRFSVTPVDPKKFLLVVILENSQAKTKFVNCEEVIPETALMRLESLLNVYVAGRDVKDITLSVIMEMESQMGRYGSLITPIVRYVIELASGASAGGDIRFDGVDRLLEYPEYSDTQSLREMLGLFENNDELATLVSDADNTNDVSVYIGKESSMSALRNSSMVFKKIVINGEVVGAIGVIGPARMDYSKVISTIRYLSDSIEGRISELGDGGQGSGGRN